MKWIPLKERLVSEKTINRNAEEMAKAPGSGRERGAFGWVRCQMGGRPRTS